MSVASVGTTLKVAAVDPSSVFPLPPPNTVVDPSPWNLSTVKVFSLDASDQFLSQMKYIADHSILNGGDIVFAIHLGDVWQHQTIEMDEKHRLEGFEAIPNKWLGSVIFPAPEKVYGFEVPKAKEGFRVLSEAGIPFGIVPGNHDYDALWSAAGWPPTDDPKQLTMSVEALGILHAGGLNTFREVFGENSEFFENKDWYAESYDGGTNSAQIFEAGGYKFHHLALEMSPMDDVLSWASSVLNKYDGLPTFVTTHDYLNSSNEKNIPCFGVLGDLILSFSKLLNQKASHEPSGQYALNCLLYTSPSPRDKRQSRMPSSG